MSLSTVRSASSAAGVGRDSSSSNWSTSWIVAGRVAVDDGDMALL
jgi:hypothetical protein